MTPRLLGVVVRDAAAAWRRAGFVVENIALAGGKGERQQVQLSDTFRVLLDSRVAPVQWCWDGLPPGISELDGISIASCAPAGEIVAGPSKNGDEGAWKHPNSVCGIDHVVLKTKDIEKTHRALEAVGLHAAKVRQDIYPGVTQMFYWAGDVILEVVGSNTKGMRDSRGGDDIGDEENPHSQIWGVVPVVGDMCTAVEILGSQYVKPAKDAVQPGRRIATLRSDALEFSLQMAFLTPHVKKSKM